MDDQPIKDKNLGKIQQAPIIEEMQRSYLDYAMSVIVTRALPDVKDGLKPVQRRIIYAMHKQGLSHTARYQKSAAVVGEVLKNYHPHGDAPVYEAMVRMAQTFSLRYMLVDGQGNFGCFTKDTEIRLADGRDLSFEKLLAEQASGKKHWTFSFNLKTSKIEITEVKNPRLTRKNAELVEVKLDNNKVIRCTPDHRFMLRNGEYKQAQHLKPGDSLMPLYTKINNDKKDRNLQGDELVHQPKLDLWESTHHLTDCWNLENGIYENERKNNGTPKRENALKHFTDFSHTVTQAQLYNHKVLSVTHLLGKEDVYDITVDPWHNFALAAGVFVHNSIDGDSPAAMRYTEAKLSAIADELLRDINKQTVDFIDNYSGTTQEPVLLPSVIPNLLLNGASGIAVGMATQIPPHHLGEVCDALIYMIDHPLKPGKSKEVAEEVVKEGPKEVVVPDDIQEEKFKSDTTVEDLMQFIKGPDFPTGASIYDQIEIQAAYTTGRGRIVMRAKAEIDESTSGKTQIIVSELPYQVNKATLIARIADLVKDKKLEGIADLRDESDRKQMVRIVLDLKRDGKPKSVLNNLFKYTAMQSVFNVNLVALVDGVPHLLTLKHILEEFVHHRQVVVRRRAEFELAEAKAREHILEGLKIAVDNIDAVIETIKKSKDSDDARENLMTKFKLSELQAVAILDMQLRRLAALERQKIEDELVMVRETITYLEDLLAHPEKILGVIKEELIKVKDRYADERRTRVYKQKVGEFSEEDLVANETTIVTITEGGYIKRQSPMSFRTQQRGGKGVMGISTKETDAVSHIFYTQTHDNVLFFTDKGRVFQIKVWEIQEAQRAAKGQAIVNLINIEQGEKVTAVLTTRGKNETAKFMFMCTKNGTVKKTPIAEYANIRKNGLVAIKLDSGDHLGWVSSATGKNDIIIVSEKGQSIRFNEAQVKPTHRDTSGVRGIKLAKDNTVVSLNIIGEVEGELIVITENGLGKKTKTVAWSRQGRGGQGVKAAQITPKTGSIVTAQVVDQAMDTLVLTSNKGQTIKMDLKQVPTLQRQTQGVILMRVRPGEKVAAAAVVSTKEKEING